MAIRIMMRQQKKNPYLRNDNFSQAYNKPASKKYISAQLFEEITNPIPEKL